MKLFSFAIICAFLVLAVNAAVAQINIINRNAVPPDSNILFVGRDNSIEVVNTRMSLFQIRAMNSSLTSSNRNNTFNVFPASSGSDTILISDGEKLIFKKGFRLIPLPSPQAKLGTLKTDEATSEEITINGWLVLHLPNCTFSAPHQITSFEIGFESDEVNADNLKVEGDRIPLQAKKIIRSLKPGDVVFFENIVAKNAEGVPIHIPDFSVTIKAD